MLIRPVAPRDLDALYQIALESGPGFTSLMPDRDALARKIDHSVASFGKPVVRPGNEHYLFVLEDPATGDILGTTGIEAAAGIQRPLVHLHRQPVTPDSSLRRIGRPQEVLTPCQHYRGCTEICSLYLRPSFRRANAGKLLSRVRFVFMALHPERFADLVIAEMRGVWDRSGESPFRNWLRERAGENHPEVSSGALYTDQMSEAARAALGEVHADTRPARAMLEKEGFRHTGYVDPVDGGPTLECPRRRIASVQNTLTGAAVRVARARPAGEQRDMAMDVAIVANSGLADFRATVHPELPIEAGRLVVPERLAEALGLSGDTPACYLPFNSQQWPMVARGHLANEEIRYAY